MVPALSLTQVRYIAQGLKENSRLDDRGLLDFRKIELKKNIVIQTAGSAQCSLGNGSTDVTCVISAEAVQNEDAKNVEGLLDCNIDCHSSIPMNSNLFALISTLRKALRQALRSSIDVEQLVILRSSTGSNQPTRAWQLHVDVTITNTSGGNIADVLFTAVYTALQNVQLPKTRVIKSPIDGKNKDNDEDSKMDIFDVRGSLSRTARNDEVVSEKKSNGNNSKLSEEGLSKCGIDFELVDSNAMRNVDSESPSMMKLKDSKSFPIGITINFIDDKTILLDATAIEEACFPYVRRLFILYSGENENLLGTFLIPVSIELGSQRLNEERINKDGKTTTENDEEFLVGTCPIEIIQNSIDKATSFAKEFHKTIQQQAI